MAAASQLQSMRLFPTCTTREFFSSYFRLVSWMRSSFPASKISSTLHHSRTTRSGLLSRGDRAVSWALVWSPIGRGSGSTSPAQPCGDITLEDQMQRQAMPRFVPHCARARRMLFCCRGPSRTLNQALPPCPCVTRSCCVMSRAGPFRLIPRSRRAVRVECRSQQAGPLFSCTAGGGCLGLLVSRHLRKPGRVTPFREVARIGRTDMDIAGCRLQNRNAASWPGDIRIG